MNSDKICLDANVVVAWVLVEKYSEKADALIHSLKYGGIEIVVPPLFHPEVATAIRKQVYFKGILPQEGDQAFSIYQSIPIRIIEGIEIYRRAWQLASAYNLPVCYDTQYLAVAEIIDCPLWTNDIKFVNALRGRSKYVRWLGDYPEKEE
jgi:predicted nucleic acid-binding protein